MLNPVFFPFAKAMQNVWIDACLGIEHAPKAKKDPNAGAAFAKNVGVQQDEPSDEKEANVQAHLTQLAAEAKARYLNHVAQHPHVEEFPRSDLIVMAEEEQAERDLKAKYDKLAADISARDAQAEINTPYGGAAKEE